MQAKWAALDCLVKDGCTAAGLHGLEWPNSAGLASEGRAVPLEQGMPSGARLFCFPRFVMNCLGLSCPALVGTVCMGWAKSS
jgi:hypothetical protein